MRFARFLPRGIALGLTTGFASGETTQHVLDKQAAAGLPDAPPPVQLTTALRKIDALWLNLPPFTELRERATLVQEAVREASFERPGGSILEPAAGTGRVVREAFVRPRTVTSCDRIDPRSAAPDGPDVLRWDLTQEPPAEIASSRFAIIVLSGFCEQTDDAELGPVLRRLRSLSTPDGLLIVTLAFKYPWRPLLRLVPRTPRIILRTGPAFFAVARPAGWKIRRRFWPLFTPRSCFGVWTLETGPEDAVYPADA